MSVQKKGLLAWQGKMMKNVADGLILGAVYGWFILWHGFAVAFDLVFVWNEILLALHDEWVSALFSGTKKGLDRAATAVVIVFR